MRICLPILLAGVAFPLVSEAGELFELGATRRLPKDELETLREEKKFQAATVASGSFDDNTQAFCLFRGISDLAEIAETELLFNSHVEDVDLFLDDNGEANFLLIDFTVAARDYLPETFPFDDRTILSSIMFAQAEGRDRAISTDCASAIDSAVLQSLLDFFVLMGMGENFMIPDNGFNNFNANLMGNSKDEFQHEMIDTRLAYSWVLDQMETTTGDFERFIETFLGFYEAFGEFEFFNGDWIQSIRTWEELALTPMSIVGKYSAVYLTRGSQLRDAFEAGDFELRLNRLYDLAVETCNAPTGAPSQPPTFITETPSASPSVGVATTNELLPVVSVIDFTLTSPEAIADSWTSFRAAYPERFFCLLQPRTHDSDDIHVPLDFIFDNHTAYVKINVDYGESFYQSDWYDLCGIVRSESIDVVTMVPLYMGLNEELVEASLEFFERMVTSKIGTVSEASPNFLFNWIDPLNRNF